MKTNTTPEMKTASIELLDVVFRKCSGRANVSIGGDTVGYDREREEVFIKREGKDTIWMPAGSFLSNVTDDEAATMRELPVWDGSNGHQISQSCLVVIANAVSRYRDRS